MSHAREVAAAAASKVFDTPRARDVAVVVTELAANAVRHGDEPIHLRVTVGDVLRVEVHDGSPSLPVFKEPTHRGGFGMHLIDTLADRWGADRDDIGGKQVWAEFRVARQ